MPLFQQSKPEFSSEDKTVIKKVEILTESIERIYPSLSKLMFRSFISGIFFSLGTTIGLSLILATATFLLTQLRVLPGVEELINNTQIQYVLPAPTEVPRGE